MASVSFSLSRNGDAIDNLSAGAQTITEGTSAPGAGNLEVRIDNAVGWTKADIRRALDNISDFFLDPNNSSSISL